MKITRRQLRQIIREALVGYPTLEGYELANKKNMMLDQPGMEDKCKTKIHDYLKSMLMMEKGCTS